MVKTKKIEFTKDITGHIYDTSDLRGVAYTALQIADPRQLCNGLTYLWIYDWRRGELMKLSPIVALIGWRDNPQGFAVEAGSDKTGYELAIVGH
jgi:hypothetical protein